MPQNNIQNQTKLQFLLYSNMGNVYALETLRPHQSWP